MGVNLLASLQLVDGAAVRAPAFAGGCHVDEDPRVVAPQRHPGIGAEHHAGALQVGGCHFDQGLIILAGVTGSGKSTTIASMLDYMNEREALHILTIEDPIEFVFTDKMSVVNQREIYLDVSGWQIALKHAVREDPDVILVGEMRDAETFEAGVNAAETGHVVFGTIHASNAYNTVDRILGLFPPNQHNSVRMSLSFNLKAVVAQKLLPSILPGVQRVPTNEIMIVNPRIREMILKGEDSKLLDAIRASNGRAMTGRETSILDWMRRVAGREGIGICPETAVCFDCLQGLCETGQVRAEEEVVVFNTGAAQKYPETVPLDLPRIDKDRPVDYSGFGSAG